MTVNLSLKITFPLFKQLTQRFVMKRSMLDRKLLGFCRLSANSWDRWLQWGQCALPKLLLGAPASSCSIAALSAWLLAEKYSSFSTVKLTLASLGPGPLFANKWSPEICGLIKSFNLARREAAKKVGRSRCRLSLPWLKTLFKFCQKRLCRCQLFLYVAIKLLKATETANKILESLLAAECLWQSGLFLQSKALTKKIELGGDRYQLWRTSLILQGDSSSLTLLERHINAGSSVGWLWPWKACI